MAYSTIAHLTTSLSTWRLVKLTDDGNLNAVDSTVAQQALDEASGLIDSYAARWFTTPLTLSVASTAYQIQSRTEQIAAFILARRKDAIPQSIERMYYDDVLPWLKDLRNGTVFLAGETIVGDTMTSPLVVMGREPSNYNSGTINVWGVGGSINDSGGSSVS